MKSTVPLLLRSLTTILSLNKHPTEMSVAGNTAKAVTVKIISDVV
jgi:hypothetical protein